ncbi:DNA cytosine methyltransferase [Campylobacter portucalensis]|uniref:DNA cytosine methyltransferase n=1 Tax=Campylobacter portucalensis TaxID=2608384 RepID=UPI0012B2485B|nr:DNA cytosine methyltransferase [Campylobacter portucalensis]
MSFTFIDLFAGIGGFSLILKKFVNTLKFSIEKKLMSNKHENYEILKQIKEYHLKEEIY